MSTSHGGPKHPYHLVDPSPWPLIGAGFAGLMFGGAVIYMHGGPLWLVAPGFVGVVAIMAVWWRDRIPQAGHEGHHTPVVQIGLPSRTGPFLPPLQLFFASLLS